MKEPSDTLSEAAANLPPPAEEESRTDGDLEHRFQQLAEQWKRESLFMSSPRAMERLASYQQVIALGPAVIPLLLKDMEQSLSFWFGALHTLTGAKPIRPEHAGRIQQMVNDWLEWGRAQGYRW